MLEKPIHPPTPLWAKILLGILILGGILWFGAITQEEAPPQAPAATAPAAP